MGKSWCSCCFTHSFRVLLLKNKPCSGAQIFEVVDRATGTENVGIGYGRKGGLSQDLLLLHKVALKLTYCTMCVQGERLCPMCYTCVREWLFLGAFVCAKCLVLCFLAVFICSWVVWSAEPQAFLALLFPATNMHAAVAQDPSLPFWACLDIYHIPLSRVLLLVELLFFPAMLFISFPGISHPLGWLIPVYWEKMQPSSGSELVLRKTSSELNSLGGELHIAAC